MKYHGSDKIMEGRLSGATDLTDHFYFFCPSCPDKKIVRILDFEVRKDEEGNPYDQDSRSRSNRSFTIAFRFTCEACGLSDVFKISNTGWQGGTHADTLSAAGIGGTTSRDTQALTAPESK